MERSPRGEKSLSPPSDSGGRSRHNTNDIVTNAALVTDSVAATGVAGAAGTAAGAVAPSTSALGDVTKSVLNSAAGRIAVSVQVLMMLLLAVVGGLVVFFFFSEPMQRQQKHAEQEQQPGVALSTADTVAIANSPPAELSEP